MSKVLMYYQAAHHKDLERIIFIYPSGSSEFFYTGGIFNFSIMIKADWMFRLVRRNKHVKTRRQAILRMQQDAARHGWPPAVLIGKL